MFVQDGRTEEYLVYWHRRHRTRVRMTIVEVSDEPMALTKRAVKAKRDSSRDKRRRRGSAWDEVWCVFDAAEEAELHSAIAEAEANDVSVAVSDPCIDLWFVLHFEDRVAEIAREDARSRARHLLECPEGLSDAALVALEERYPGARTRAKALEEQRGAIRANPSCDIWRLIDRLVGQSH